MIKPYIKQSFKDAVRNSLRMSEREKKILEMRFGFDDGTTHTLEEVGKLFGVTRERIRQAEDMAIRKMEFEKRSLKRKKTNK